MDYMQIVYVCHDVVLGGIVITVPRSSAPCTGRMSKNLVHMSKDSSTSLGGSNAGKLTKRAYVNLWANTESLYTSASFLRVLEKYHCPFPISYLFEERIQ
jgi:hypothetical protein